MGAKFSKKCTRVIHAKGILLLFIVVGLIDKPGLVEMRCLGSVGMVTRTLAKLTKIIWVAGVTPQARIENLPPSIGVGPESL